MLTITIIFTLLVALWGNWGAIASAAAQRSRRRRSGADSDPAPARIAPPIGFRGH